MMVQSSRTIFRSSHAMRCSNKARSSFIPSSPVHGFGTIAVGSWSLRHAEGEERPFSRAHANHRMPHSVTEPHSCVFASFQCSELGHSDGGDQGALGPRGYAQYHHYEDMRGHRRFLRMGCPGALYSVMNSTRSPASPRRPSW